MKRTTRSSASGPAKKHKASDMDKDAELETLRAQVASQQQLLRKKEEEEAERRRKYQGERYLEYATALLGATDFDCPFPTKVSACAPGDVQDSLSSPLQCMSYYDLVEWKFKDGGRLTIKADNTLRWKLMCDQNRASISVELKKDAILHPIGSLVASQALVGEAVTLARFAGPLLVSLMLTSVCITSPFVREVLKVPTTVPDGYEDGMFHHQLAHVLLQFYFEASNPKAWSNRVPAFIHQAIPHEASKRLDAKTRD